MSLPAGVKARAGGRTRPVPQLPEPSRFWIGSAPRTWRVADRMWSDVAAMTLAGLKKPSAEGVPELAVEEVDDLFYIPPITEDRTADRDQLIAALIDRGVPILVHVFPGEDAPEGKGVIPLYDLLEPLLDGADDLLATLPADAVAVWPLIPGITDDPTRWEEALEVLALRRVAVVQPQMLELSPMARRRLAEGRSEEVFDALFHGRVRFGERRFAIHVQQAGLSPFFARPVSERATPRQQANREVAANLALAGELSLRLGHSVAAGQAYFRAARGAETTSHDLRALAREKNLKVLDWLDERSMQIVEEQLADPPRPIGLERLKAEYLELPLPDDADEE
ncbi:MAG: hypothetical protein AAGE94_22550 [Acidobacteriota bacterium]